MPDITPVSDFYENRILSLTDVARLANLSLSTLRREIQRGTGPKTIKISCRRVGVRQADVRLWLIRQSVVEGEKIGVHHGAQPRTALHANLGVARPSTSRVREVA